MLSTSVIEEANQVGKWLDDYVSWAGQSANETPLNFHIGGGLYLASIAVGRRLYIQTPWRQWAVKVRRATGFPKYVQIAGGSSHGLYGADYLSYHQTALFCEGEFDVLIARQEVGKWVCPVSLGSASNRLPTRWQADLSGCRNILVAYDNDEADIKGAEQLLKISPRFHERKLPFGKDISDYYLNGGDVYEWLSHDLQNEIGQSEGLRHAR